MVWGILLLFKKLKLSCVERVRKRLNDLAKSFLLSSPKVLAIWTHAAVLTDGVREDVRQDVRKMLSHLKMKYDTFLKCVPFYF